MAGNGAKKHGDWREARRMRALELKREGWSQVRIAEALGVTQGAVSQWVKAAREEGKAALKARKSTGRPPLLSEEDRGSIPGLLKLGARSWGFANDAWTLPRIADVIARHFGVRYCSQHVSRIMRQLGWSPQKPITRAFERDEQAIEQWQQERWPALKKGRKRKAARSASSTNPAST